MYYVVCNRHCRWLYYTYGWICAAGLPGREKFIAVCRTTRERERGEQRKWGKEDAPYFSYNFPAARAIVLALRHQTGRVASITSAQLCIGIYRGDEEWTVGGWCTHFLSGRLERGNALPAGLFSRFLYYRKRRPNQSASSKHPCTRRFRRILP